MRRAFLSEINRIIPEEEDVVFLTVDLGMWAIKDTLKNYANRCMNIGIYEGAMTGVAAGLAMSGMKPIIFGIQPYVIERNMEQIKLDFAYQKVGGTIVGTGAAVDYSKYGYSHYCPEDYGVISQIPGVEFIVPGTAKQFLKLFRETYRNNQLTCFRISDHPNKYEVEVEFGKATIIKKGSKATIIVVSVMLDIVLEALGDEDVTILYYTTLEPFDEETLAKNCPNEKILICEPQYVGDLLYHVHNSLEGRKIQVNEVGLPREICRKYGSYDDKMKYYGITVENVRDTYNKLMAGEEDDETV